MDDIYYQKYLKYKNKYLSLKKDDIDDQYAGANIKVLWKAKVDVTRASDSPQYDTFKGAKIFEFGTVTDKRKIHENDYVGEVTKKVTTPYVRIDAFGKKEIYEIKSYEIDTKKAIFSQEKPGKLIIALGPLEKIFLHRHLRKPLRTDDTNSIEIYLRPCHPVRGLSDLMKQDRTCQKDRGIVRLDFKYMLDDYDFFVKFSGYDPNCPNCD